MSSKKTKGFHFFLVSLLLFILASTSVGIWILYHSQDSPPIILFILKDQADTPSLNPTRLITASKMAFDNYFADSIQKPTVEHHYLTYSGDENRGYEKARVFLENNPEVIAIIGDINSRGTGLFANLAEEFQIPHISFFATDNTIFTNNSWSFSYRETIAHETEALESLILNFLQLENVFFIVNDLQNLIPRWQALLHKLEGSGINTMVHQVVQRTDDNFYNILEGLRQNPDLYDGIVAYLGSNQIEHFLQQMSLMDIQLPVVSTGVVLDVESIGELIGLDVDLYSIASEYFLFNQKDENRYFKNFARDYRIAIGYHRVDSLGPWIYDGMTLLYELLESAETPVELRNQLEDYNGQRMIGWVNFDEDGNLASLPYSPVKVESGMFHRMDTNK